MNLKMGQSEKQEKKNEKKNEQKWKNLWETTTHANINTTRASDHKPVT